MMTAGCSMWPYADTADGVAMGFSEQLDATVERIIDSAIEFYMETHGWFIGLDGNYHFEHGGNDVHITPPGHPDRTSGGKVMGLGGPVGLAMPYDTFPEFRGGSDVGSLIYGHFQTAIRELFRPWHSIPRPEDFDTYIDDLREGAWYISLTSSGSGVAQVANAELKDVTFLLQRVSDMAGDLMLAFDENFCTPLPTVMHGQYAVAVLTGVTLCAEKEIWVKARADLLDIADNMLASMKNRGGGKNDIAFFRTITAIASIGAVFPTPAQPVLAGVAAVLPALETLVNGYGGEPTKPDVRFAGGTPDKVIGKAREGLAKLAETIRHGEDDIRHSIRDAMETVTSPGHASSFDMPKPKLLQETRTGTMKLDLDILHRLATVTMPNIEKQLNLASDRISQAGWSGNAWYRTAEINTSDTEFGPYAAWTALAALADNLICDLAWEVRESAAHLAIASDRVGQTEAQVEASLRRHAEKIEGGSGVDPIGGATTWLNEHR